MARKEFETLTPQMYYILLVLLKPRHGYEIMNEIARLTDNNIKVGAGTLYTLLPRFESEGYILLKTIVDRKKIYQITDIGRKKLRIETEKLSRMLSDYQEVIKDEKEI